MLYQCARCMTVYDSKVEDDRLLCPHCRDRVKLFTGPRPEQVSEVALILPEEPILPLPEVSPISYEFTRLTKKNFPFWYHYAVLMRLVASNVFTQEQAYGYQQAVRGFLDALECFENTPTSEVWVAYAMFGSSTGISVAEWFVRIEMCMTVTTHPDIPISTHMGIFRSPLRMVELPGLNKARHLKSGGVKVPELIEVMEIGGSVARPVRNLSVQLHAFAARSCLRDSTGVKKVFMITAPLLKMLEILREKCGAFATETITSVESGNSLAVQVGTDDWPKRYTFTVVNIEKYPWLTKLAALKGGRPTIAIELKSLEDALDERPRVELVRDWVEKKGL